MKRKFISKQRKQATDHAAATTKKCPNVPITGGAGPVKKP